MAGKEPAHHPTATLAGIPGLGSVFDCGSCGNVHVTIGPVTITLEREAYMQVVAMLNTSAANFEVLLHHSEEGPAGRMTH
jgi:hypothetical protein